MIVQVVKTVEGKTYLRVLGPTRSLFYELVGERFEKRPPPPPSQLALAQVEQRTF